MEHNNGHIPAGFDTYLEIINRYIDESDYYNINKHFKNNISGVMSCFGTSVMKSKNFNKALDKYIIQLNKFKTDPITKDIDLIIDSGGYQIISGQYTKTEIDWMIDNYYKFLEDNLDLFDRAFILDLPINENCFNSYDELYEYNLKSYKKASELPKKVRDKIIYVHHFTSPKNNNIFESIFNQVDAMNKFKNFAVGGVARRSSTYKHYINNFTIPIVFYIRKVLEHNLKSIRIHFLGADNPDVILFYKLAEVIIKEKYDIELEITYDSAIFISLAKGKNFKYVKGNDIKLLKFFSKYIDMNEGRDKNVKEEIINRLNDFAEDIKITKLPEDTEIYIDDNMNQLVISYMLIHNSYFMDKLSSILHKQSVKLYNHYKEDNPYLFNEVCFDTVKNLRFGKVSRYAKMLINNLYGIVDILDKLDYNKTNILINNQIKYENYFNNNNNNIITI